MADELAQSPLFVESREAPASRSSRAELQLLARLLRARGRLPRPGPGPSRGAGTEPAGQHQPRGGGLSGSGASRREASWRRRVGSQPGGAGPPGTAEGPEEDLRGGAPRKPGAGEAAAAWETAEGESFAGALGEALDGPRTRSSSGGCSSCEAERISKDHFLSTRVHVNGEEVCVEWRQEDPVNKQRLDNLDYLSTAVHLDGEAVWEEFPETTTLRPIYLDIGPDFEPAGRLLTLF